MGHVARLSRGAVVVTALCLRASAAEFAATPPPIDVELVTTGVVNATAITRPGDGSGRLFITQQAGQIRIVDGTQLLPAPFLDLSSLVLAPPGTEQGLLDVAFHPNYINNGFFYVNYTRKSDGATVVARYSRSNTDPNLAYRGSSQTLLVISRPFGGHYGGQMRFGPDGYLYIASGDAGSECDPLNNGQRLDTLLGKLLRIDVDHESSYAIPPANPFAGTSSPSIKREIWAYGLRNPWRFSFDRVTGDLFIADVGQANREEVNFQAANSPGGQNYGWRCLEGSLTNTCSVTCSNYPSVLPVIQYDHSGNFPCWSITGGYRYRGAQIPDLYGTYVFADYCSGRIWGATQPANGTWATNELFDSTLFISTFGEDDQGELYLAHYAGSGAIYRIVAGPRITSIQLIGADTRIGFTTLTNHLYRVESATNPTGNSWTPLTNNVTGTGGIVQVTDPGAGSQTARFYRVKVLP